MIIKLIKEEKGNADLITTAIAFILIMGIFLGFAVFTNSARAKVIMNYSAKEGARIFGITKSPYEAVNKTKDYLSIGGIQNASVNAGDTSIKIEKDIKVYIPFFIDGSLKLTSEVDFYEELNTNYYNRGSSGEGWLSAPVVKTRPYNDDSYNR